MNKKGGEASLVVMFFILSFIVIGTSGLFYVHKNNQRREIKDVIELNQEALARNPIETFTKNELKEDKKISILSFGDAMFDRGVKMTMDRGKDPFEFIKNEEHNLLKGYDFWVLNLEGPITTSEIGQEKEFNFKFEPKIAGMLKDNNFNIVNLANNHSFDYFSLGFKETKENLDRYGVDYFGGFKIEESYKIKDVGDKKVAFIGIDESTTPIRISNFYPLIKKLKTESDFVVVNIHWGYEYDKLPSEIQRDIGRYLIDSGADIVFGHHPHVVQPVEIYNKGVIFYSLGNFIFDQIDPETRRGIGIGSILEKTKKIFYIFPFEIVGNQPKLLDYSKSSEFCNNYLSDVENNDVCRFDVLSQ